MGGVQRSEVKPSLAVTVAAELGMWLPTLPPDRKTEAGPETRPAGRIPEGFQTILVIWSPGPLWSPVKLRNVHFAYTPEGYRKDTGRVTDIR